jgi:pimeloyl-ACP methyl ester carboxylesterase
VSPPAADAVPNDLLRRHLAAAVQAAALSDAEPEAIPTGGSARKRARLDPRAGSRLATVALVEEDEVLRWVYDPPPASARRRARRAGVSADDQEVIHGFQFLEVPPNEVVAKLQDLDFSMTPSRGLRVWTGRRPGPLKKDTLKGRLLLLVHGTFSRGDMFFEELAATPDGEKFLAACAAKYDAVLTFDHPSLAMSPWINALDLARATAGCAGPIDVVCHSRGGLAVAWWLYQARPPVERVVFVGSPLEGTSLAAPANLKRALDLLGNLSRALGTVGNAAATAVPMLAFAGGLMKVLGGVLSLGGASTLVDAGLAIVPGLAAQSRVGNNFELERLFAEDWGTRYQLHAVLSNYEPSTTPEPWWKFWTHFREMPGRVLDWGADVIFSGPNDLVVDTPSMIRLGHVSVPKARQLAFDGDDAVHHCGYFRQPRTVDFLQSVLKV